MSVHNIERNDLTAAVELVRTESRRGPIGRDTLEMLAMLQDEPMRFYEAIQGVEYEVA
jgi:hypothetical protein